MLTVKEIKLEDDLDWDELIKKSNTASFFQTKEWLQLWVKHFNGEVKILGVFAEDSLIGIAPLQEKEGLINFLGVSPVLGGELVSDFGDIIAVPGREKEIWEKVITHSSYVIRTSTEQINAEFNFVREDSPTPAILQNLCGSLTVVDVAPYIDLPVSWDDYLSLLDRHSRHELRRKMRRWDESGGKIFNHSGDGKDIEEFFRLMQLGGEQKRKFLTEEMKSFFSDIYATFWPKRTLELTFLKLEDRYIAATLNFLFKNEVLLYNSGFDPQYAYLSPGLLLKAFLIKHSIEEGKRRFDFLRGRERYKYDLGGRERRLYKIRFDQFD